jgi:ABC-2 type transport system permease protein
MKNKTNYRNVMSILKKELQGYLDNPASYVVLVVFLVIWFFLFFRSVFVVGEASLSNLFSMYPWFGLVLISAITMGTIAKEQDDGTLEFVLTHPVKEIEFVLGKISAGIVYTFFAGLFTLPIAIVFSRFGTFDWGVYASQLLGFVLFSAALVSLGVFLSSLFNSQIASLLSTLAVGFVLILAGTDLITISLPFNVAAVLERISLLSHYDSVIRGVIDFYDLLYFAVFILVFVLLTLLQLYKRKYGDYKARYSILQSVVASLIIMVFLISSLKVWLPLRVDVTQNRIYTLTPQTKQVLKAIEDPVTITLYASEQLPSQYAPVLRDIKYILGDYKSVAGSKVNIVTKDPSKNIEDEQFAVQNGIQKVQFNVIGQDELQLKGGYLGVLISYNDRHESLPFLNATNDLEYQLTSIINQLTNDNKPSVAFLNASGSKTIDQLGFLAGELQKQFTVIPITLSEETPTINESIDTLVIAAPLQPLDENHLNAVKEYLSKGKNLVILGDSFIINSQLGTSPTNHNLNTILNSLGVNINKDIAFDLQSYSRITFSDGNRDLVAAYPYWVVSVMDDKNPINLKYVQAVTTFWPSSITVDNAAANASGYDAKELLVTTTNAGVEVNPPASLPPAEQYPSANIGKKILAVVLEPKNPDSSGRIAVIADTEFVIDSLVQRNPENISFASGVVSWASGIDSLSSIQIKNSAFSLLKFSSPVEPAQIRFGIFATVITIPLVLALIRFTRRRALRYQRY